MKRGGAFQSFGVPALTLKRHPASASQLRDDVQHMADRPDNDRGADVMSSLPAKRPQRPSARRAKASTQAKRPASGTRTRRTSSKPAAAARTRAQSAARGRSGAQATGDRPAAVRPSAATARAREPGPKPTTGDQSTSSPPAGPPSGVELITTAVQAAGELAQIGLSLGVRTLRGAISRLPRP